MQNFGDFLNQGLLAFVLGSDFNAVEVVGFSMYANKFDGTERVVLHYLTHDYDIMRDLDTKMDMYEIMDEVVYFGSSNLDNEDSVEYTGDEDG
jgi:hypothetical protein